MEPLLTWEDMVRKYQKKVYSLAYHMSNNAHEADDITQETFLKAFEGLSGFRHEAGVGTWLSKIAVNVFLAKRRKRKTHESMMLEVIVSPDWSLNPERVVIKREMQWCINHILEQHIPQKDQKMVLILRDFQGFSYHEIAEILGISLQAVKSRLFRARKSFKAHLEKSSCCGLVKDYTCYCEGVREV